MIQRNALIKHETLPSPSAVLLWNLFEIAKNASTQMMDFPKALLLQKTAGLFTANATGSKHGNALRALLRNARTKRLIHPVGKVPEAFRLRI